MLLAYTTEGLTSLVILGLILLMLFILAVGWIFRERKPKVSLSPYTHIPLRPLTDVHYSSLAKVKMYMDAYPGYDNQMFNIFFAALCRETGRIFPNAISWTGKIHVDWAFIHKRYPGTYVSWGSLGEDQQRELREAHGTLDGFQTDYSSSSPNPKDFNPAYIHMKPGPLYVNIVTKELVGWKCVPETDLEVLIVQKPLKMVLGQ